MRGAGRAIPGLLRELDRSQITLDSIQVHRPTLDDVFLSLTGRSLRDAEATPQDAPSDAPHDAPAGPAAAPGADPQTLTSAGGQR